MTCDLCAGIERIEAGEDPYAIARLTTGYVKLCPTQYFRGYTYFIAKECVPDLHDLPRDVRDPHLRDMAEVAHALARTVSPRKLNYEALGNSVPHLHWHLVPRFDSDPHPRGPIWEDMSFLREMWTGGALLDDGARDELRAALLTELRRSNLEIEREYLAPNSLG